MDNWQRHKNRWIARMGEPVSGHRETLGRHRAGSTAHRVPWCPVTKPLAASTIALVTTAGVHHAHQRPFDMLDRNGDASFRVIDPAAIAESWVITHDYYDHRGADRDLNVVFPVDRLREMEAAGVIGGVARRHLSFMGHIQGGRVSDLVDKTAPEAAGMLLRKIAWTPWC